MNDDLDIPQLPAGGPVIDFIITNYRANQPVMLEGDHGTGKSASMMEAARQLGIRVVILDISLMDNVDLTGIPYRCQEDNRTHYAAPAEFPVDGEGILVLEEPNRGSELVRGPILSLCTARRLNQYVLPPGWVPMATINPRHDGYATDDLDPAFRSRFSRARVVRDRARWVEWAKGAGVHPAVVSFVELTPKVFDKRDPSPRSWDYVSNILKAWEQDPRGELQPLVAGHVGEVWSVAFLRHYQGKETTLTGPQVADSYAKHRALIRRQIKEGRIDVVEVTIQSLKDHLAKAEGAPGKVEAKNIGLFLDDLPGDLKIQLRAWLAQNGLRNLLKRG